MAASLSNFTVVESQNIALGQAGVIFKSSTTTYTPPDGAVVIAITFVTDTVFASGTTAESTRFTGQATGATNGNAFASTTFPAGLTIYGRFTAVDLHSGSAIYYLGS